MDNYKKDKSYIKQRLEYVNSVDYISELEEQIENLQEEKEDYKSRCENAIEYINKNKHLNWYVESIFTDELENILNGGDEE